MSVTEKSPGAFRTISEAADELDVPAHVLKGARKFIAEQGVAALLNPGEGGMTREPVAVDSADREVPVSSSPVPRAPGSPHRGIPDVLRELEDARAKLKSVLEPR